MPREYTITTYEYDELSQEAQERARDWFREGDEFWPDFILEDFGRVAEIIGVTLSTHIVALPSGKTCEEPDVWWSGFCCQGDGACFEGAYRFRLEAFAEIRAYASQDESLHGIADALHHACAGYVGDVVATVRKADHHYSHEHTVTIDTWCENGDESESVLDDDARSVNEALRNLMRWLYRQLESEYEYQTSDEAVAESIRANEYEFTADGERFTGGEG